MPGATNRPTAKVGCDSDWRPPLPADEAAKAAAATGWIAAGDGPPLWRYAPYRCPACGAWHLHPVKVETMN